MASDAGGKQPCWVLRCDEPATHVITGTGHGLGDGDTRQKVCRQHAEELSSTGHWQSGVEA